MFKLVFSEIYYLLHNLMPLYSPIWSACILIHIISSDWTCMHVVCMYLKVVGNKPTIRAKITFLRYSTGGSGMVSGLFFSKNFVKILIFRFTISFFVFFKTKFLKKKIFFLHPDFIFWPYFFEMWKI